MIYLDYSATTPMSDQALHIYTKVAQEHFGNPNSLHDFGLISNEIVSHSRKIIAQLINGEERGIYFTSGGSESNFLSLLSLSKAKKGKHIITTEIEHPSVLNTFLWLADSGFDVSYLPVNQYGEIEMDVLKNTIREDTILVSIGHSNAELGTLQDIETIGKYLQERNILFHSDCVQSFGKIPIDVQKSHLDCITISGHKIYGPKGIGACYINPKVRWRPLLENGTHESGFRQGTLNVPAVAAFATATEEISKEMNAEAARLSSLKELFLGLINNDFCVLEGHPNKRLPHHISLRIKGIEGQYVMLECNRRGIAISTGSACKVGQSDPPKSMIATGKTTGEAHEFIRITLGKHTTEQDIRTTATCLNEIIAAYFS